MTTCRDTSGSVISVGIRKYNKNDTFKVQFVISESSLMIRADLMLGLFLLCFVNHSKTKLNAACISTRTPN